MSFRFWDKIELSVLLAGLIIAGGFWGFIEMSELARETGARALDAQILLSFRVPGSTGNPIGPSWLEEAVRDVTALGSVVVLVLVTVGAIFYLMLIGRFREAIMVFVAVGGGQLLSSLLKLGIDRPRPDLVPHLVEVQTLSFPSGHAMMAAVTYLTLGAMLAGIAPGRMTRAYLLGVAVLITLMVGVSRIYLGVHWPSDVLAGWCAGFAWSALCWLVARRLLRPAGAAGSPQSGPAGAA